MTVLQNALMVLLFVAVAAVLPSAGAQNWKADGEAQEVVPVSSFAITNISVGQNVRDGKVYYFNNVVSNVPGRAQTFTFKVSKVSLRPSTLPVVVYFVWTACLPEELCYGSPNYNMTFQIYQGSVSQFRQVLNGTSFNQWTFMAQVDQPYRILVTLPNLPAATVAFYLNMSWSTGPPSYAVILLIVAGIVGATIIGQFSVFLARQREEQKRRSGYVTID